MARRLIVSFTVSLLIAAALSFLLFGIIPAKKYMRQMELNGYMREQSQISPTLRELMNEAADARNLNSYLKNLLALSRTDSIYVIADLRDSVIKLGLKGVILYESKILEIKLNAGLKNLPLPVKDSLFSSPLQIIDEVVSIEKFPIVVKRAPKDTSEANRAETAPMLPVQNDVFMIFNTDNNLVIEIGQQEKSLAGAAKDYRKFRKKRNEFNRKIYRREEYTYRIIIKVSREDARTIYRALPANPYLLVNWKFN